MAKTTTMDFIKTISATEKNERIQVIDIVRGFALFGVFLVNSAMFNGTLFSFYDSPLANPWSASRFVDWLPALFIQVLGEGKFYTIFSFLFGLGFYLFIDRATKKHFKARRLFARRLFFLLIFGILNFSLVWFGDILHVYALIGFFLLLFWNKQPKALLIWASILIATFILIMSSTAILEELNNSASTTETAQIQQQGFNVEAVKNAMNEIYQEGSFADIVIFRVTFESWLVLMNLFVLGLKILGMFLLGLYAGKKELFKNIALHIKGFQKATWIGALFGGLLTLAYVSLQAGVFGTPTAVTSAQVTLIKEISTLFLSLFYVSGLVLLVHKGKFPRLFERLNAVGQMALTNYLSQCILLSLIFYNHGLGLMYQVSYGFCVMVTCGFFLVQMAISPIWLKYHKHGPFEWVWRKLTYGNAKPMVVEDANRRTS